MFLIAIFDGVSTHIIRLIFETSMSEEEREEQSNLDNEMSDLDRQLMREELEDQRNTLGLIDSEEEVEEEQDW